MSLKQKELVDELAVVQQELKERTDIDLANKLKTIKEHESTIEVLEKQIINQEE